MEPKAKRLRGFRLEQEKAKGRDPLFKGGMAEKPSALGTLLLTLWSHGQLSPKAIQEIAYMAMMHGASHPELAKIGSSGNWGGTPGNCHRDVMTHFCQGSRLNLPAQVQVAVLDPKISKVLVEDAAVFLPHLLFSDLGHHYPEQFQKVFATDKLEEFWKGVEKTKDDRLVQHPICQKGEALIKGSVQKKETTIPLFLHCDGVEFQSRDTLLVWNWGCLLNHFHSLASHFLLSAIPKACTTEDTWEPLMAWITWSLEALLKGYHPELGPDKQPLMKGSIFEKLKGLPLTPGHYRAVVWAVQGDHEMYSNILGLPHWNSKNPCWDCDCSQPFTKGHPCSKGKSFKLLKEEEQKYVYMDTAAALVKGRSSHILFSVPGLTTRMVRHDGLHVLFVRGVCSHLVGSILHFLCYFDGKHKQSVKPTDRLALIFDQVQSVYREKQSPTRLTNLKLSMITDPKKPHAQFAKLDCKGAEMKHFCCAFLPVLKTLLDAGIPEHKDMIDALQAMVGLVELFDSIGYFPTSKQYAKARDLEKRFFHHYSSLSQWADKNDRLLFHVVMKHHTCHHMIRDSCFLNPKFCWNFRSEDFVGKISRLGASVAMGVKSTKMSQKIAAKYQILLHMQLSRLGFDDVTFFDDP